MAQIRRSRNPDHGSTLSFYKKKRPAAEGDGTIYVNGPATGRQGQGALSRTAWFGARAGPVAPAGLATARINCLVKKRGKIRPRSARRRPLRRA